HILLDAHLDQVGLIVTSIEEDGFLRAAKCGGLDLRTLMAQEVTVHGAEALYGVVPAQPPHLAFSQGMESALEEKEIFIDIGLPKAEAERLVPLGSRVSLRGEPTRLHGSRFTAPALDNRAGVAAILRCLELLEGKPACRLTVLFSVQEETTGSGARGGAFAIQPEEAIAVDVSFARAPGVDPGEAQGVLGKGTMIGFAPSLDLAVSERLASIAGKEDIPFTREIMGGASGTNADRIQTAGGGVPCGLLSIPLRNMHTAAELLDLGDVEATARLLAAYLIERGRGA
ncbi:MAG: M42 family peptidase, partial [Oscillospiraceae bacterium]|nr:M42 family peptidase [Oscillospiraceae bacterium]